MCVLGSMDGLDNDGVGRIIDGWLLDCVVDCNKGATEGINKGCLLGCVVGHKDFPAKGTKEDCLLGRGDGGNVGQPKVE